jgi:type IV secretory pathway VirB2 component (pilin)
MVHLFNRLWDSFKGRKTYSLAVVAILYALAAWYLGKIDSQQAIAEIWAAITAAAIRHGISNETSN